MAQRMFSPPTMDKAADAWEARSLRSILGPRSERNRPDLPLLSVARERGVFVRSADDANHNAIPEDLTNYKIAQKGDLVVNKMKAWQGSLGLAPVDGIVSPAYFVFEADFAVPRYGEYLLRSKPYVAKFGAASDGVRIGQWDLSIPRMRDIEVYLPPAEEQAAIVKYLAHANARIDKAIAAKRRLIFLLDELAASIQSSIVTAITEGDEIISIGQSSSLVQTGPFGSQLHADEYVVDGIPVINPAHIGALGIAPDPTVSVSTEKADELRRHRFETDDIVLARRGDLGRSAVVLTDQAGWLCGTGSLIVRLHRKLWNPEYFQMVFSSKENKERLQSSSFGSTMANLNAAQVGRMRMQRPTLPRQESAVREVRRAQADHALRLALVTREITLLQEFRTRLVADVVTGQIDVRAIAATLPDAPESFDNTGSATDDDLEEALSEGEE